MFENLKCLFTNFPWDLFWMLLLPLLLLWWLMQRTIDRQKHTIGELRDRVDYLERELDGCQKGLKTSALASAPVGLIATDPNKKDDLKMIEGIGPKIEILMNQAGIYSFAGLANATPAQLKAILDKAGSTYQVHDPATWPAQAMLARDGLWNQLKNWQEHLKGGRIS